MRQIQYMMKPQDVVILMKIIAYGNESWQQVPLADSLGMSQSEVSHSLARSRFANLLDESGRKVMRLAFMDFLQYGIAVVFPAKPGAIVRGIPTSHSAPVLSNKIVGEEAYVWPSATGTVRGHSISPLYPTVPQAVLHDEKLYDLLALADALRVGRAREKNIALDELKQRIADGK